MIKKLWIATHYQNGETTLAHGRNEKEVIETLYESVWEEDEWEEGGYDSIEEFVWAQAEGYDCIVSITTIYLAQEYFNSLDEWKGFQNE